MKRFIMLLALVFAAQLAGCVSSGTHQEVLDELERLRKASGQSVEGFAGTQQQTLAELEKARMNMPRLSTCCWR
ncbi:MAG: hypothetical protein E8D45_07000 [Nitrospira sp.]|nr:MAG: hypothetical protein E8D45_07000 [Nitrospira sp.]